MVDIVDKIYDHVINDVLILADIDSIIKFEGQLYYNVDEFMDFDSNGNHVGFIKNIDDHKLYEIDMKKDIDIYSLNNLYLFSFKYNNKNVTFPLHIQLCNLIQNKFMNENNYMYVDVNFLNNNHIELNDEKYDSFSSIYDYINESEDFNMPLFKFEIKDENENIKFIRPLPSDNKTSHEYEFPVLVVSSANVFESIIGYMDVGADVYVKKDRLNGVVTVNDLIVEGSKVLDSLNDEEKAIQILKNKYKYEFTRDLIINQLNDSFDFQMALFKYNALYAYFANLGFYISEDKEEVFVKIIEAFPDNDNILEKLAELIDISDKIYRYQETYEMISNCEKEIENCKTLEDFNRIGEKYKIKK